MLHRLILVMLVKRGPFTVIATCFSWDYLHTMNEDYQKHYIIPLYRNRKFEK